MTGNSEYIHTAAYKNSFISLAFYPQLGQKIHGGIVKMPSWHHRRLLGISQRANDQDRKGVNRFNDGSCRSVIVGPLRDGRQYANHGTPNSGRVKSIIFSRYTDPPTT